VAQRLLAELPEAPPPGSALARLLEARLHMIGAEEEFRALGNGSAVDARWGFLQRMRDLGHAAAAQWLADNLALVGVRSTMDLCEFARPVVEQAHVEAMLKQEADRTGKPTEEVGVGGQGAAVLTRPAARLARGASGSRMAGWLSRSKHR
jgi:hypothetical protein